MRTCTTNREWLTNEAGELMGLNLGFDFCYEHETAENVNALKSLLGVPLLDYPRGVPDRKITVCPDNLVFLEYEAEPRDMRRNSVPAASLLCLHREWDKFEHLDLLERLELRFYTDVGSPSHSPKDDVMCGWRDNFGINVRGADNVAKLRLLYEAFRAKDIAMAWGNRRGISFVIHSTITDTIKANTLATDEAHIRLHLAVQRTDIYATLKDAGKDYYALAPDWYDREKEEGLLFYLNPHNQAQYHSGWFSLAELLEWAQGRGPVVKCKNLEAFSAAHVDWHYNLVAGLKEAGINIRHHAHLVWMADGKPGISVRPAVVSRDRLPEGVYPFAELTEKYKPKPEPAQAPGAVEG